MYTVINKESHKVTIYFETSALSRLLEVDRSTIYRRFEGKYIWENERYLIYKADEVIKKTRKTGNRDNKETRVRKLWEKNN